MPVTNNKKPIYKKALLMLFAALVILPLMFFIPAGTIEYWQAWLFCATIFIPFIIVFPYLLKRKPELLARRMQYKEKEANEKHVIKISNMVFLAGMLIPGLDRRFHWSVVPTNSVLIADLLVLLSYLFIIRVFLENSYASRIVEVTKDQKVISTGPYAFVRHPMYLGILIMYLAMPVALGSYWAIIPFLALPVILGIRILDEERLLRKELPGYKKYCQKTRWRILPFIW
jgi:protein-S-isoprenylcysteine O-methyltransferase Ste14